MDILLADDNPLDVRLALEAFAHWRPAPRVHVVGDGEQAWSFLRRTGQYGRAPRPDLVVLDVRMPRRGGFEVLADLRRDPVLKDLVVAVMTSSDASVDVERARSLKADAFCTKAAGPGGMRLVAAQLQQLMGDRAAGPPSGAPKGPRPGAR